MMTMMMVTLTIKNLSLVMMLALTKRVSDHSLKSLQVDLSKLARVELAAVLVHTKEMKVLPQTAISIKSK